MNRKMIARIIAMILFAEAVFMLPALGYCIADRSRLEARSFLAGMGIILLTSGVLLLLSRRARKGFYARDGLVTVGLGWIVISMLGCLPFVFSGAIPSYVDALFEMVSGFTTTGASILTAVEPLPRSILYWRSFSHWVGGMGVLVFVLAFAPTKGNGEMVHVLRAESPGPSVNKLVPRMQSTALILYFLYILLTVLDFIFLMAGGMDAFEAVCTAFGTAGTGGFGVRNDSIASYSPYIQNVCTVFMFLFGVNFSLYYLLLCRNILGVVKDQELQLYVGVFTASIVAITLNIRSLYGTFAEALRHAAFQVSSIMTTTGFATADFDLWPSLSKGILLTLMIIGACAGSTGGGMKCGRVVLLVRTVKRDLHIALHPRDVRVIKVNDRIVDERTLMRTNAYLAAYVLIIVASFLLISFDNFSVTTNISAVLACFNNIGPGLEVVGPTGNYAAYSAFSKIVLTLDMLLGRLEIMPILLLLTPQTWKR